MQATSLSEPVDVFDGLFSPPAGPLPGGLKRVLVPKNRQLFFAGARFNGIYLIVEGSVKIFRVSADGKEKVIDLLQRGDCLGEVAMLLGIPYDVSAQTVTDAVLVHIPEAMMADLISDSSALVRRLLATMSRRVHGLICDVEASSFKSGHQRVADFIISLLPPGVCGGSEAQVRLPAKKLDLASRLDLSPQHFSRILQDLRKQGLIGVDGQVVSVPSVDRLRRGRMSFD